MKITFIGAGSTVFAANVIGDCILTPELGAFDVCLFDIDPVRLDESYQILSNINKTANGKANIVKTLDRTEAFTGADFVVNAIQVGGYEPCTVTDFEIPKKYGLRQTIADTLGIGGIFRALRTIPVMESYAEDMERLCPRALFLNYTNPMAMLSGYMQRYTSIRTVGLCHSVQGCAGGLLNLLDMGEYVDNCRWEIAGINHQAWLLRIEDLEGNDLYPEIKRRAQSPDYNRDQNDLVRLEIMKQFGYYVTESSEHTSEYTPYFIKDRYPELIQRYKIPLDDYPRRCVEQIKGWREMRESLLKDSHIEHKKTHEFASYIIQAADERRALPNPRQCAEYRAHHQLAPERLRGGALPDRPQRHQSLRRRGSAGAVRCGHRTNINVQLLTIQAARTRKKEDIYMAAMLDPHTSAELSIDDIRALCDDLIEAHNGWLPAYH